MRERPDAVVEIVLYERAGCCLCEEMQAVVASLGGEFPLALTRIDIGQDPALEARFGDEVPVLFVAGRKAFTYRVTADTLRERLRRVTAGQR
jgi:hypothetical protein